MPSSGPPPAGGDYNRAGEVHAFTWTLEIISLIFVVGRMYSRLKLTRNVWWDDWCVCFALILDFVVAIMWSIYAASGYARHLYYLNPAQISNALELNTISRSLCMFSIAIGKISVAFLIERIAGPSDWRKWLLRGISISIFVSAVITFTLFYAQCQPTRALWDKDLIKEGTGNCWNPIPVNTWDLVIASYWAFLDFALAFIPVDIVWKLQLSLRKKLLLTLLLGMGVFAGICAAVKTSKVPITVKAKTDITWKTIELLMWNGIEMNVIIIAACIPTLRPIFLILFKRPGAQNFRASVRERGHSSYYYRTSDSDESKKSTTGSSATNNVYDKRTSRVITGSTEAINNKDSIEGGGVIQVESREVGSSDGKAEEGEWAHANDSDVPMADIGSDRDAVERDCRRFGGNDSV
ncbi:MAG: hypothetical protein ASARMPREDX12_003397 [Alectoria sarmentosa]|nr:MAG: hypothetical protein ASARMPREDX12_003397 [Alectoria sarmentosa]